MMKRWNWMASVQMASVVALPAVADEPKDIEDMTPEERQAPWKREGPGAREKASEGDQ